MSRTWMPFYVGDYLRDTMHLTPMQHGMYLLLILHYWEHGCLPDTSAARARVARSAESTWRDHESTLAAFFEQPGWRHKRIDLEIAKDEKRKQDRRITGTKGGTATMVAWNTRQPNGKYRSRASRGQNHGENQAVALPLTLSKKESSLSSSESELREAPEASLPEGGAVSPALVETLRRKGWA